MKRAMMRFWCIVTFFLVSFFGVGASVCFGNVGFVPLYEAASSRIDRAVHSSGPVLLRQTGFGNADIDANEFLVGYDLSFRYCSSRSKTFFSSPAPRTFSINGYSFTDHLLFTSDNLPTSVKNKGYGVYLGFDVVAGKSVSFSEEPKSVYVTQHFCDLLLNQKAVSARLYSDFIGLQIMDDNSNSLTIAGIISDASASRFSSFFTNFIFVSLSYAESLKDTFDLSSAFFGVDQAGNQEFFKFYLSLFEKRIDDNGMVLLTVVDAGGKEIMNKETLLGPSSVSALAYSVFGTLFALLFIASLIVVYKQKKFFSFSSSFSLVVALFGVAIWLSNKCEFLASYSSFNPVVFGFSLSALLMSLAILCVSKKRSIFYSKNQFIIQEKNITI